MLCMHNILHLERINAIRPMEMRTCLYSHWYEIMVLEYLIFRKTTNEEEQGHKKLRKNLLFPPVVCIMNFTQ